MEKQMSQKALIVYGTRFGATTGTAEEIGNVLHDAGNNVRIANLKKEKIKNISEYDLVIVGSGMMMNRWTSEPEKFLKKFRKELADKKLAVFVSSGGQKVLELQGKTGEIEINRKKYLDDKMAGYDLHPVSMIIFGGAWNFNNMPWWASKAGGAIRQDLEKWGLKETSPGIYDTRDWDTIRNWSKSLTV